MKDLLLQIGIRSISNIWEFVRNANSPAPPQPITSEYLAVGPSNLLFNKLKLEPLSYRALILGCKEY